ncbi:MAG TPA: hypothetical protein VFN53_07150 [Acidobacteriaceae bacterium]|nr:hypothetical protein [Acidobacteriaceae bacterium]
MLKISIYGYSGANRSEFQPLLLQLLVDRYARILEESSPSPSEFCLKFELALFDIVEVYAALQQTGIQFTPLAHRALTEMCLCQQHFHMQQEVQTLTIDLRVMTHAEDRTYAPGLLRFRSA